MTAQTDSKASTEKIVRPIEASLNNRRALSLVVLLLFCGLCCWCSFMPSRVAMPKDAPNLSPNLRNGAFARVPQAIPFLAFVPGAHAALGRGVALSATTGAATQSPRIPTHKDCISCHRHSSPHRTVLCALSATRRKGLASRTRPQEFSRLKAQHEFDHAHTRPVSGSRAQAARGLSCSGAAWRRQDNSRRTHCAPDLLSMSHSGQAIRRS